MKKHIIALTLLLWSGFSVCADEEGSIDHLSNYNGTNYHSDISYNLSPLNIKIKSNLIEAPLFTNRINQDIGIIRLEFIRHIIHLKTVALGLATAAGTIGTLGQLYTNNSDNISSNIILTGGLTLVVGWQFLKSIKKNMRLAKESSWIRRPIDSKVILIKKNENNEYNIYNNDDTQINLPIFESPAQVKGLATDIFATHKKDWNSNLYSLTHLSALARYLDTRLEKTIQYAK